MKFWINLRVFCKNFTKQKFNNNFQKFINSDKQASSAIQSLPRELLFLIKFLIFWDLMNGL